MVRHQHTRPGRPHGRSYAHCSPHSQLFPTQNRRSCSHRSDSQQLRTNAGGPALISTASSLRPTVGVLTCRHASHHLCIHLLQLLLHLQLHVVLHLLLLVLLLHCGRISCWPSAPAGAVCGLLLLLLLHHQLLPHQLLHDLLLVLHAPLTLSTQSLGLNRSVAVLSTPAAVAWQHELVLQQDAGPTQVR